MKNDSILNRFIKLGSLFLIVVFISIYFFNHETADIKEPIPEDVLLIPSSKYRGGKPDVHVQKALYYFSLGELANLDNKVEDAIEFFKKAHELDPKSWYLQFKLGEVYVKKSEFELAKKYLKQAIGLNNSASEAQLLLGNLFSAEKDFTQAIRCYKKVIYLEPTKEQAYILLGTVYAEQNDYSTAVSTLKTLLKVNAQSFLGYYYLGRMYTDIKKYSLAVRAYKDSLDIHPTFDMAILALGSYYEASDHLDQALHFYLEKIEEGADDSRIIKRALQLLVAKKDYPHVIRLLENLKHKDPTDLNNRVRIGLVYFEMEKFEEAKNEFETLLKENPDSDSILFYLSAIYEKLGALEKATQFLKKIGEQSRFYKEAMKNQVVFLMSQNKFSEASEVARRLLKKYPDQEEFYDLAASVFEKNEAYGEAIKVLEQGILKFPKEERLTYYLGALYDKMGDVDKSLFYMNGILKQNPNHPDALNFIGYSYVSRKTHLEEAEQMILKALKLKAGYGYIEDSLGWLYFIKGDYRKARTWLEKAYVYRKDEPVIIDHLADTYVKLEVVEKAYELYQKALKFNPDQKIKIEIENKIKILSKHEKIKNRFPATLN